MEHRLKVVEPGWKFVERLFDRDCRVSTGFLVVGTQVVLIRTKEYQNERGVEAALYKNKAMNLSEGNLISSELI